MDDGTTLEEFISNLDNESSTIKIYDKTGNEIKDTSKVVKTGLVVKLVIENTEYDSLIIIVRGDINEDGIVDISDKVSLVNHILLKTEITDYRIYAFFFFFLKFNKKKHIFYCFLLTKII